MTNQTSRPNPISLQRFRIHMGITKSSVIGRKQKDGSFYWKDHNNDIVHGIGPNFYKLFFRRPIIKI